MKNPENVTDEKWKEICFLLSENIKSTISESSFEKNVLQVLRILGWTEYLKEVEVRPSLQYGSTTRLTPDFIIKESNGKRLFVVEIKQPDVPVSSRFQKQLFSYMRQLKLEYGLLIGQNIQIFYDGPISSQEDPILLETIKFDRSSESGSRFVSLFSKEGFAMESLNSFTLDTINKHNRKELLIKMVETIKSRDYQKRIKELIKKDLLENHDGELIDIVLEKLSVEVFGEHVQDRPVVKQTLNNPPKINHDNLLPIELDPPDELDFKRALMTTKKAFITEVYEGGKTVKKKWNASRFQTSSNVMGNLRSRPEFRKGEWEKRGLIKVFVSIFEK